MTRQEFNRAFTIAQSQAELPRYAGMFDGFGLKDFQPVICTLRHVAELIRWQGQQLNGEWDMDAVEEIAYHGRHKFHIVGNDSDDMQALAKALTVELV